MKSETMYRIVDPDGEWTTGTMTTERAAWAMFIMSGDTKIRKHFERTGYRCQEVLVTPVKEEEGDKDHGKFPALERQRVGRK